MKKYRIAVVDDDFRVVAEMTKILKDFFGNQQYIQDDYYDGEEFVQRLISEYYDIVFMDIEMKRMNGQEAIKRFNVADTDE